MIRWSNKNVVVTGGARFLGSNVVEKRCDSGCKNVIVPRSKAYDLRDLDAIIKLLQT